MDFGEAIRCLKMGHRVNRTGWNGKGMYLVMVPASTFEVNREPWNKLYPAGTTINYQDHIDMYTAQGTIVPWLASQSDILAEDWCNCSVVELPTNKEESK